MTEERGHASTSTADFAVSIGRVARRIRKQRGLTLVTVAGQAGISASLLSRVETGEVTASLETFVAVADALGVHPALLLQEIGTAQHAPLQVAEHV
jgi:transcriptional regulator with XRE-family HTH domain